MNALKLSGQCFRCKGSDGAGNYYHVPLADGRLAVFCLHDGCGDAMTVADDIAMVAEGQPLPVALTVDGEPIAFFL